MDWAGLLYAYRPRGSELSKSFLSWLGERVGIAFERSSEALSFEMLEPRLLLDANLIDCQLPSLVQPSSRGQAILADLSCNHEGSDEANSTRIPMNAASTAETGSTEESSCLACYGCVAAQDAPTARGVSGQVSSLVAVDGEPSVLLTPMFLSQVDGGIKAAAEPQIMAVASQSESTCLPTANEQDRVLSSETLVADARGPPSVNKVAASAAMDGGGFVSRKSSAASTGVFAHAQRFAGVDVQPSLVEVPLSFDRLGFPTSYDLRSLGAVTSIKDQGSCGSCWAFATYGSLESTILVDGGTVSDLSENHLKNYHGFDYGPCEGGNSFISQAYLSRGDGPVREVDDPYHDYDDRPSPGGPPQYYAREMLMFDTDDELKYGLITYGAIATSMHMNTAYFDPESNTYYYNGTTCPNHGVTIVGWDDTVAVPSAPGPGGWLVKNSGGTAWGDEGYFWISYYDTRGANDGFCFHDVVSPETYQTIYYHDRFGYIDSLNRSFAFNAFKATSEQDLVAVGFWTLTDGASYDVRVYSTFSGGSLSGLLAAETGICTFAGAHTIDLAMPLHLTEGQDFYIYVQLMDAGTYPMAFDIRLSGYNSASSASPGQSYYSADGANWTDLTTFHPTANFCIKGLAAIPSPPEVTVLGNGISISDGSAVPRTEDHTQFGVAVLGGSPVSRTFVVVNEGTQTLSLGSVYVPAGFTLTEGVVTNLTAGDSDTFTVQLDTGTIGSKNGDISFSTNDSDENPFNFRIAGTVVSVSPPEVSVLGNGIIINDGDTTPSAADHTDFGNTFLGSPGISRTFTVRNEGGSPLTLGTVTVPTGFTLAEPLVSSLAVGASDTFTVRLDAVLVGSKSGDVAFVTNDPDENPFSFQISGVVEALPSDRTVGNTTVFSEVTLVPNRRAVPYTMSEAGQLESISIYHDGGSGRVLLAVYADGAGKPGARLGVTDSTVIHATEGWQTVDLPSPVSVSGGQTIWLAWVFENNPGIRFTAGTPGRADSTATWSDGMPTTFGTCAVASYVYSIYATYSPSTGTSTVGNTTVFSGVALVANRRAVPYTMTEAGQLESITIYHDGGTGHLILAVYGDSTGKPGTRLGVTSSTVIHATEGWQTVNLQSPISVASGQTIWLAWLFENNPGVRFTAGTPGRADSSATWSGGMPSTFGASTVASYIYSIYATYNPSTGTNTVGNTTVFSEVTTAPTRRAAPYTMTEAGQLESISIYHEGGSGHLILAVYGDSAGKPGTRLGITNSTVINATESWQTVNLQSPLFVASGQIVWLAWVFENNPGIRFTAGTPGRADSSATWSGGMPTTFGTSTVAGYIYSVYATYSTGPDTTPPADVSGFTAMAGDEQISLSWTNPTDADFAGVKILRKTGSHPTTPTDGTVVYDGTGTSTTDTGLTNGTTYYYTAFSYDGVPNYSAGATTSGTPEASTTSTIGNTTVFSEVTLVANRRAVPYTMSKAGQLESMSIYHDGGSGRVLLAVYADSVGKPGARLGITNSTVINAIEGWQTVNLQSLVSVASGQTIWLAWVFENNPGVRFTAGTPGRADSTATWSGGMPSTFGTSTVAGYIYSIYATYSPSTGTSTVGNTTVFSEVTTAATRRAAPYTMTEAGQLESISIYHEGGSGHVILAVYADSAGKPGARLGITNPSVIHTTEGWQTVGLQSPVFVASGQAIWLAWVFEDNPGIRFTAGTPGRADSSATWLGGMPTMFGACTIDGYIYSVYATYAAGTSGNSEVTVFGNGVSVADGDSTPSVVDGTDFGNTMQGDSGIARTFTVRNDGGSTLILGPVTVPTGFTLTEGLASSLDPGASDSFAVRLDTATAGTRSGDISFSTNDADENPFNFRILGVVMATAAPEVTVLGNGLPISDEDATPSAGDYTDFGSVAQGSLGVSHHFTVRNDGTATLTLGAVIVPPGFTLIEGLVSSLAPGTSDTFTVRLNAAVLGTKTGDISFPNNDSDESPFNFQITGAVIELVAPEIAVFGNGMEIEDGDTTPGMGNYEDFGFVIQQDSPVSHLFVVRNNGTAVLTLGPVSVPTGFTLTDGLPSSLGPGESDAFTVRLDTAVLGTKTGDVSFANNDSDENPFNFRIIGRVVGPAPEITVLGNDVEIGDGDTTPSVADHTDFGSVLLGSLPVNHIFTVRNDGGSSLTLGPVTVPVGFTVSGLSDNVEPGEWDEFTVQLDTAVLGTKGGYVSFATNDSDENPFNFWITGDVTAVLEPEITVLGNDVEIMDGDTTPFVADHTDFGSVAQGGSPISRTFTVHNEGVAILTLGDVVVPPGFTLTEGLPVSLAPGESDTFTVRLDTATPGTRTRDVTFTTNDEDEGLFNFRIVGMVRDPHTEITVLGNGIPISDGDATPSTVDGTDFGRVLRGELFMGQPWIRQTFTVRNDGTSTLTLASVTAPSGFEVVERPRLALAPGSSDTFTVQMYTSFYVDGWYGIRGGDISFVTNDSDESPFNFQIRGEVGEPVGPEITVDGIWNGDTTPSPYNYTDLGPAAKGGAPAASVFKVRNDGIATLTLGPVTVPTGFTLAEGLSTSLEPGREDMFTVRLDTGIVGTKRGVVSFTTNDPDASVFSFQIAGEVVDRVVPQFASYAENFEGEFLWMIRPTVVEGWQYYSSAAHGRIEVGYGRLRMDCAVDSGTYCLNEAILHLDLTDHSNVHMTLDHWNISDENTSLPSTFTGHCNGDGIALSVDGVHWVKVMDLAGDFTAHSFLLDTFVEQAKTYAGSPDVSDVRIKFQQYGNSTRFSDGRDFDNIATTQPVYFADPGLKTAVEQQLGISDPCALDMLDLWELDAGGMGISDLTGLECAKNLHRLHAPVNQIDDLSPLAGLPLGSLCLDNNGISDITTLSALPTLGELYLNENQISDITAIAGLVNLGRLELNDNQISDLSPIASLTKLDRLEMSRNAVVDISPLSSLRNLMTLEMTDNQINDISGLGGVDRFGHLFLSRNQISDISPLWGADLGWLRIDSNHISDMTPICWAESLYNVWLNDNQITHVPSLSELISLEVLDLLNNQIDDLTGFEDSGLPELWYIRLNENRIADLRPLSSLSGLPELQLELSMNQISDLRPLSNLSSLSALTLEGNQIADIGPLSGLVALEGLGLSGNQLTDIGAVVSLINLRILNLQFNQISELRPVSGLINLRALTFGHNQVEDISPLGGLMNLQWLSTYENRISDISVLSGLANLSVLYAYSNQISDISPLSDLANLAVVDLHENHISDISLLVELRALISLDLRQNPLNSDAYDIYLPLIAANNPGMSLEYDAEQIVYFADANLRTAVEEALGISDPTPAEILGLTSLSAETRGILSVIGLEYAVNLRSLDLSDNEISDISPLSELTNLTYLDLRRNPLNANAHNIHIPQIEANNPGITLLYDLAEPVYFADANLKAAVEEALGVSDPLPSDMLTLVNVNFDGREIADLTGIEYAENLTGLWLNNNEITDIGALAGLVRLYTLMLNHNQISDLSAVSGMTDLMYLEVMENQVVDIGPLAGLSNLEVLRLDGNLIEEVGPLSTCANLSLLWLDDNEIVSLNALVGLTNLRHLHVNRNSISDLTPIAGLVNLIDLELSDNQVSDLSPISGLRPYTLFLDKNQISDLSPLAGLLGIHTLSLQSNQIGDLNPLSGLVSLWSLCLDDNQIGDLNPLSGLVNLGALHLAENQIADLSPLSGITGLGELDLADNQIVDLTCLSALTGLGTVNLARNQISDISALSGLTELEYLDLRENPLNEDAYSIYIPQILANNPGMNMEYDPQ